MFSTHLHTPTYKHLFILSYPSRKWKFTSQVEDTVYLGINSKSLFIQLEILIMGSVHNHV